MASLGDNFITQCCHENAHPARGYRPNEHFYYDLLVLKMKINSEAEKPCKAMRSMICSKFTRSMEQFSSD